ncbi:MAG: amino acid adenylation domain-containing protein [Niastella sp.]|uniref:amino acid adenylation domain-containing protein n=1 Tax=Niastella sp. TaxID=1869183 RepID=UPI003899B90D
MRTDEYISALRKNHNIIINVDNNELKIRGSQKSLTSEIVDEIKARKTEIITFFKSVHEQAPVAGIPATGKKEVYVVSPVQKRLFFLYQLNKTALAYNMPRIDRLEGELNKERLQDTFTRLFARHEILRTRFEEIDGEIVQKIIDPGFPGIEEYHSDGSDVQTIVERFIRPFDLTKGMLMRVGLIVISPKEHYLLVDMHHIIADGSSQGILIKEFITLYNKEELPPLHVQYKDYAEWGQAADQRRKVAKQGEFWINEFSEEPGVLHLPADFARPAVMDFKGDVIGFEVSREETTGLKKIAEEQDATLFMVLLSAYAILLAKLGDLEDIVIGIPIAGRQHPDLENMIGMFVNTLPLRNYPKGTLTYREFLLQLKTNTLACFDNQDFQFGELLQALNVYRDSSRNPLFDVMFMYENYEAQELSISGLTLKPYRHDHGVSKFDISLKAREANGQLLLHIEYSTALFKRETIERFISYFKAILSAVIEDPERKIADIKIISEQEENMLLQEQVGAIVPYPEETLLSVFERQVERTPENTALIWGNKTISYAQLCKRSDQIATWLQEVGGIEPGDLVGLLLERGEFLVPTILGIGKAGAAYVPIDPSYPASRIHFIIADAGLKMIISQKKYRSALTDSGADVFDVEELYETTGSRSEKRSAIKAQPAGLAYIIYTSGSTGKPKGVMVEHRSLANMIRHAQTLYPLHEQDRYLLKTTYCFDVSCAEIFGWFMNGGALSLLPEDAAREPREILATIQKDSVTHINFVPSLFAAFVDELERTGIEQIKTVKYIFLAGEALPIKLVRRFKALNTGIPLWNIYGPTEGTIYSSAYNTDQSDGSTMTVPIGKPLTNIRLYILDRNRHLMPPGVAGELYIGGIGVARGYLHNEELTSQRFPDNPFNRGERIYKTGDRARRLPDGNLEYLGRIDDQVKIRGYRIEPGEIESRLAEHPEVQEAVVVAKEMNGSRSLVAYYLSDFELARDVLRAFVLEKLPDYMAPSFFIRLQKIPLNANGKVDRKALPDPLVSPEEVIVAPQTKEESLLVDVWSQVLGMEKIGITNNFFLIGGDSIKSIQICSRVRSAGYELTVKDIFAHQTIRQLAPKLKRITVVSDQSVITGRSRLSPIQHWFFNGPVKNKNHFTQSVLLHVEAGISYETVYRIFKKIQEHHDALRMVFTNIAGSIIPENKGLELPVALAEYDLRQEEDEEAALTLLADEMHASIDLATGPLMRLGLFHMNKGSRLLIVIHHLVVDGISWRILFEDFETLYQQLSHKQPLTLPLKTDPFLSWPGHLEKYYRSSDFEKQKKYWKEQASALPRDYPEGNNLLKDHRKALFRLDRAATDHLLTHVPSAFNTQINDILLTALLLSINKRYGQDSWVIDLETHGRQDILPGVNFNRTIGWFTSIYPVLIEMQHGELKNTIRQVKETLRKVPGHGIGYLLQKYQNGVVGIDEALQTSGICFNYLGQFDADTNSNVYSLAGENKGNEIGLEEQVPYDWSVSGMILNGQLEMSVSYSVRQYMAGTMESFMKDYEENLRAIIEYCSTYGRTELTPSDLIYKDLPVAKLDEIQAKYTIENISLLSPMQEGILYHSLLDTGAVKYLMQTTCRVKGELNVAVVAQSLDFLMARYDILRTIFLHEGYDPHVQVVLKERRASLVFEDIRKDLWKLAVWQLQERERIYDLSADVLMRLVILQTEEKEYELIWGHHHLLMDGWCMGILVNEFMAIYSMIIRGKEIVLPPVKPWSKYMEWLGNREKERSAAFWREYLSGYDSLASLPQQTGRQEYAYKMKELVIDENLTKGLSRFSGQYGITQNTIIQGAWAMLLARYNNTQDVVFGSVVSGRPAEIEGVETMVGLFINTIPVRIHYSGTETVVDYLQGLQARALESEPHHYHPLSEIQALSEMGDGLFDHIIAFENYPLAQQIEAATNAPFEISNADFFVQTNYELNITILPLNEMIIKFEYNSNRYSEETIANISSQLKNIISAVIARPDGLLKDISLYNEQEELALRAWLTAGLEQKTAPIQFLLGRSFEMHADHYAIEYRGKQYSYKEMGADAGKIATAIARHGIAEGSPIGIYCEDRRWLISSILGIVQSRMVFVPLETKLPASRLASMISQTGIRYIITDQEQTDRKKIDASGTITWLSLHEISTTSENFVARTDFDPEDHLYIYFTSGSTGEPKGVVGINKGLAHFIDWEIRTFHIDNTFRFGQFTNPGFDVFMRDIFVPLCSGATICIPDEESLSTAPKISAWIDHQQIDLIHCVPSFFKLFGKGNLQEGLFPSLKYILQAGEKILPYELQEWYKTFGNRIQLVNIYGPTETTLAKGYYLIRPADSKAAYIPVRPMPGAQFLILDKDRQVSPPGAIGEIYIRTPYRTTGYLDAAATKKSFIVNPYSNNKEDLLYRTGDVGKALDNGEIVILGRSDHQVKIRGIRIEPDDIRANILRYPGVTDALVLAKTDKEGETFLCAYIVSDPPFEEPAIRSFLQTHLPGNMLPAFLMHLPVFPLQPNGKINRKALPEPGFGQAIDHIPPSGAIEDKLADIWSEVLKMDKGLISTNKSFQELGGHSVRVFRLLNKIQQSFHLKLKLDDILRHDTIQLSATLIARSVRDNNGEIPVLENKEYYSTSPAQKRMYYQYLMNRESIRYNIPIAVRINGETDIPRLRDALIKLTNRHPGLRTSFLLTGDDVLQTINAEAGLELEWMGEDQYNSVGEAFNAFIRPFDLTMKSLMRCALLKGRETDTLFVDVHHIVADGISLNIMIHDFKKLYLGEALQPLTLRYVDYAGWISNSPDIWQQHKEYWAKQLSGELPGGILQAIRTGSGNDIHVAASKELIVDEKLYENIRQFALASGVSDFIFHLSVCYLLLSKLSGSQDIIIGTDVVGRTKASLQDIVGTFVNILPLRVQVRPDISYEELLLGIKRTVVEGFDHQDFQFDQMVSLVDSKGTGLSESPLIDVHLSFSNTIDDTIELDEFEILSLQNKHDQLTNYELQLEARTVGKRLYIDFIYSKELYDADTIEWIMKYYTNILQFVIRNRHVKIGNIELEN